MMEDSIRSVIISIGASDDADDGEIFAVGAGDGVEDAQTADGKRDDASADAARSRVTVGSIPGIQFVTASDVRQPGFSDQMVQERQIEVPRNGENVRDADLHQPARDVPPQSRFRRRHGGC